MSQILLIEAGGTKTAFAVLRDGVVVCEYMSKGVNPTYSTDEEIAQVMQDFVRKCGSMESVRQVRYYGAGCASLESAGRVGCILQEFFPSARVNVYSDLMAVCHALSKNQRSIVGILGTGAATCLFDGVGMEDRAPSLGYMLGDEGSGTNLGKRLLIAYLRAQLPANVSSLIQRECNLSFESAMHEVYRKPEPNKFMASLAPFLRQYINEPCLHQLALTAFVDFFEQQKTHYAEADDLPWNLSGSVAYHFQDVVKEAAEMSGCRINRIIEAPMPLLIANG